MGISALAQDLRFAVRSLRKSSGFTLMAILTLALGIGANTAIFSLVNAVLLRPLPYEQPDRLVLVWESAPFFGLQDSPVAPANYADWKLRSRSFEDMGALEEFGYRLTGEGTPEMVRGSLVTAGLFRALRLQPQLGRIFREDEDKLGAPAVAIISDGFWKRRFAADPNIIGKAVPLNGRKYTIVGVLRPGTEPPTEYSGIAGEIWTPLSATYTLKQLADRGRHNWMVIARLRDGVSPEAANAEMQAIGTNLAREYPDTNEKVGAFVGPMREHFVSGSRRVLFILLATVAFVLLIACANLANLLLSRALNRRKEVAVRAALGAGAWQLTRQFLCESLLLCTAGAALGVFFAASTFQFLSHLAPGDMSGFKTLGLDWRVLTFTALIAVVTAVLFSLVPLAATRRLDLSHSLKQSARALTGGGSGRLRSVLICSEVALAFVLLIGAGLLLRTFAILRGVDPGFRSDHLVALEVPRMPPEGGFAKDVVFQQELRRRLAALPGVASAGFINHIPVAFKGDISGVAIDGRDPKDRIQCKARAAGPGYFATVGIPLRRGRYLDEHDSEKAAPVAVINETLARMAWPGQDAIGRMLQFESNVRVPVVGVVGDIHNGGLDTPPGPEFYISTLQADFPPSGLVIRTTVEPESLFGDIRQAVWSLDRDQAIIEMNTMEGVLDAELFQRRMQLTLLAAFAGLALLLAGIGLYGVLSYLVGQQIPEIGVRMALGALPYDILRRVVGRGLRLAAVGIGLGAFGALALSHYMSSVLFGIAATDPYTYVAVGAVLMLTAAFACYLPARRAMRIDPITALREE
jgi:putative ABC transport system permease protein